MYIEESKTQGNDEKVQQCDFDILCVSRFLLYYGLVVWNELMCIVGHNYMYCTDYSDNYKIYNILLLCKWTSLRSKDLNYKTCQSS